LSYNLTKYLAAALLFGSTGAGAQQMPTTQPNLLLIIREEIKLGRTAEHTKHEAGWPAAYEKAKSPDYYLALASMTGGNEVLYVVPQASHKAAADGMKRDEADAILSAELARLSKGDAEFLTDVSSLQAVARPNLSVGAFPDLALARFWEITTFRVRPGHGAHFEAAVKAYSAAALRASPSTAFRVYEVIAGAPSGTFLVFGSVDAYGDFDKELADGMAAMRGATADELKTLESFAQQGMISSITQRYRLDPQMSYVAAETKAKDPAFWTKPATRASASP
jgi:hypothetical protein